MISTVTLPTVVSLAITKNGEEIEKSILLKVPICLTYALPESKQPESALIPDEVQNATSVVPDTSS